MIDVKKAAPEPPFFQLPFSSFNFPLSSPLSSFYRLEKKAASCPETAV